MRRNVRKKITFAEQTPLDINPEKKQEMMKMNIRTATLQDIDQIAAVEKECFPAAEAATKEEFEQRLSHYADHF